MNLQQIAASLYAYSLQVAMLLGISIALAKLLRLRRPEICFRYWQGLLAATILLPLIQRWLQLESSGSGVQIVGLTILGKVSQTLADPVPFSIGSPLLILVGVVAAVRLLWMLVGLRMLRFYRDNAEPLSPLPPVVVAMEEKLGCGARFLVSDRISVPVTFGWHRPTVLVPNNFGDLPLDQQEGVACHELLHVRRKDWPMAILEQVMRVIFWFHPLVLWLLAQIALSREQLIDHQVVLITGNRRAYLRALWTLARYRQTVSALAALPFLEGSHLVKRVTLLSKEVQMSKLRLFVTLTTLLISAILAATMAVTAFPIQASPSSLAAPASEPAPGPPAPPQEKVKDKGEVKVKAKGDLEKPEVVEKAMPVYPEKAKKAGLSGTVTCEVEIDTEGKPVKVKIVESPDEIFNQAVLDALKKWKFKPGTINGIPVRVTTEVTVTFKLK